MKLSILQEKLKEALSTVERIASKTPSLPVLGNVLLEAENNLLKLSTTNLETGINYWIRAKVEKEGKISVPAYLFSNFVNYLPSATINLEEKQGILYLECKKAKAKINGLDFKEFPIIPQVEKNEPIVLKSIPLVEGLSQVINIASFSTLKPEISGVYWNIGKNLLTLVATDSFRLGEKRIPFSQLIKEDKEYSFILPHKSSSLVVSIFDEREEDISLYLSPNLVMIEATMEGSDQPRVRFVSKLIEGEYPKYQEIIPKEYKAEAIVGKKEFLVQLKTASIFASRINEVKIGFDPDKQNISVFCQNPELGEHSSVFPAEIKGQKSEVSFNYKFLIDGLNGVKGEKIFFALSQDQSGEEGPALVRSVEDKNYIYVVMSIQAS